MQPKKTKLNILRGYELLRVPWGSQGVPWILKGPKGYLRILGMDSLVTLRVLMVFF